MNGVKFTFHPSSGLESKTFDFYYENYPMIVGMSGNIPHRYHRESIIEIIGPEYPAGVMETIKRTLQIQIYEYLTMHDKRAVEFGEYIKTMNSAISGDPPANAQENSSYYHA